MKAKRKSNNPAGRPVTVGVASHVSVLLKLDPKLAAIVDACAAAEGKSRTEWLRIAAHERCLRQAAAGPALLRKLVKT